MKVHGLLLLVVVGTACGDSTPPTDPVQASPKPTEIRLSEGGGQTAVVGGELPRSLVVKVVDATNTPVPGVPITWSVIRGGGSFTVSESATDATGSATAKWLLGTTAGENAASASAPSLPPITFSAIGIPGRPSRVQLDADSVVLGIDPGLDSARLTARVSDRFGNEIAGAPLMWASSDTAVATVNQGVVRGRSAGSARITASSDTASVSTQASVRIQMNGRCKLPGATPSRGPAAPAPQFSALPTDIRQDYVYSVPAVLDINVDGRPDVLLVSTTWASGEAVYGGSITAWENRGSMAFVSSTQILLREPLGSPEFPKKSVVADFNGDGRPDAFFAQTGFERGDCMTGACKGGPNLLYLSDASGTLREAASTNMTPVERNAFTHTAAAADIDCDGDSDLFLGRWFGGGTTARPRLMLNAGSGTFTASPDEQLGGGQNLGWAGSEFCDVDRDGDPDLIRGSARDGANTLYLNNGFGVFRVSPTSLIAPYLGLGSEIGEVRCIDYDIDGWPDLVWSEVSPAGSPSSVRLLRNNQNATFSDVTDALLPQSWPRRFPIEWLQRLEVVDLNGDRWPDLVGSGLADAHIWINNGQGFQEIVLTETRGPTLIPADVDSDGRMDLLATGFPDGFGGAQFFKLYWNRGR